MRTLTLAALIVISSTLVGAQLLDPPIRTAAPESLEYSSPYGPRQCPNAADDSCYQWHKGIDYRGGVGTAVHAVDDSVIAGILYDEESGYYIQTRSASNVQFSYLHLFEDEFFAAEFEPDLDGDGHQIVSRACNGSAEKELCPDDQVITLEVLYDQGRNNAYLTVVFWDSFLHNRAKYALCPCESALFNPPQTVGGQYTTLRVPAGLQIAVVGTSGGARNRPHLHFQANAGTRSALFHVKHDQSPPRYELQILKAKGDTISELNTSATPIDGVTAVLDPVLDSPLRIRVRANYGGKGDDLDQLRVTMVKSTSGAVACPDCQRVFDYGGDGDGRTVSTERGKMLEPIVFRDGVYPKRGSGRVDFLSEPIDLKTLEPGEYVITVSAIGVGGGVWQEERRLVTIGDDSFLGVWSGTAVSMGDGGTAPVLIAFGLDVDGRLAVKSTRVGPWNGFVWTWTDANGSTALMPPAPTDVVRFGTPPDECQSFFLQLDSPGHLHGIMVVQPTVECNGGRFFTFDATREDKPAR
jgi:murein DD-endopeptidase MepM/ murein hydrolase activator NlpD